MDPVDEEVGETKEEGKLKDVVKPEGGIGWRVVQFAVPSHFADEEGHGEYGHDGQGN